MLTKLINNKFLVMLVSVWMTGLVSYSAMAMNSANYEIVHDVTNNAGADDSTSTNYFLTDSFGEPFAGSHDSNTTYDLESGFIQSDNEVLLDSATTSESYINSLNQTAFNIQCLGVTDTESDQTITCEGSFDEINWHTIDTELSPVDDLTMVGTPDVSSWTNYPADGATTIYVRAHDGYYESITRSFGIDKDVTDPTTSASVTAGTLGSDNWYTTDITITAVPVDNFSGIDTTYFCTDQTNTCTPTTEYLSPQAFSTEGTNYFRYYSLDNAGNEQSIQSLQFKIDKSGPTASPTCTPVSGTYFKDDLAVACTPGTGGTIIRYTDDTSEPDQSSPTWADHSISITSHFKYITCDDANNCYLTSSDYEYEQDNTPPPVPTMNAEPEYTSGTENTVSSTSVIDDGVDTVQYQFCINDTDSTTGCTPSGWLTDPEYTFTSLDENTYYYFVRAKDALDNISDWSTSTYSNQISEPLYYYYYLENDSSVPAITNDDLVGWWNFENDNTTTAFDHSGEGNHGTLSESTVTTGQLGNARTFDGVNDHVTIPSSIELHPSNAITVSAWVKRNAAVSSYDALVCTDPHSGGDDFYLQMYNPYWRFYVQNTSGSYGDAISSSTINNGVWTHVVGVYDGSNVSLYINGQLEDSNPFTGNIKNSNGDIYISWSSVLRRFNGDIDEVKIFDQALSPSEISNEYLRKLSLDSNIDNYLFTEGIHFMHVRPFSSADIWGDEYNYETRYDKTAPTIDSITSVAGDTSAPYVDTTDDGNTQVVFTSSDNLTGVTGCKWDETDLTYGAMVNSCTDSSHCTLNLTGESAHTVYLRCIDGADNAASSSYTLNYTIDSTPPEVISITSVAGDTTTTYYDTTDDGSTDVIYTASADAVSCKWDETDLTYGAMANTCTDTSNCNLDLTGETAKTVYMRCRDANELDSPTSYVLNYTIDATPPSITSITSIAGDTTSPYYDTTDDSSTQILYNTSGDPTECKWSFVDQAYDSMPNTCTSAGDCTANLSGQGAKTVYIRCRDEAGNKMTSSYEVNYTIDSIVPNVLTVSSVAGDTQAPYVDIVEDGVALIVYTADTDAVACKWSNSNVAYDSMTGTCESTTNCTVAHYSDGFKSVFMRCMDVAGNKSTNSYQIDYEVDENLAGGGMRALLETSDPGKSGNILVTFTLDLTTTAISNGSIKIRLHNDYDLSQLTKDDVSASGGDVTWTNDEIIYDDGTIVANHWAWWIEHGYAAGEDAIVFPFTGTIDNSDGQLSFTIGALNEPTNPSSTGSFSVSYNLYDNQSGFGEPVEIGDGMVFLNHVVIVTATVPSYLTFDILPVATGNVNGATITSATTSPGAVDFGLYSDADDRIQAHDLQVSTNATDGYVVTIEYDQTMTSATGTISNFPHSNSSPATWSAPPGSGTEGYFGYTTSDDSLFTSPVDRFVSDKWAAFDTLPQEVAYDSGPVADQITRIGYRLNLTKFQSPGTYSTTITYIATPTF